MSTYDTMYAATGQSMDPSPSTAGSDGTHPNPAVTEKSASSASSNCARAVTMRRSKDGQTGGQTGNRPSGSETAVGRRGAVRLRTIVVELVCRAEVKLASQTD